MNVDISPAYVSINCEQKKSPRKTYYKWIGTNGLESWWSVSIHRYLLSGELPRGYMRQSYFSGMTKRMTKQEYCLTRSQILKEVR